MCGICGIHCPSGVEPAKVREMLQTIVHRGPDDEGIYVDGPIGIGNRRLSIIDLSGGHQPLCNEDGTVWISYNGEIYNYRRLRRELEAKGHVFRTRSDTEVIVHLYEELGERCVERLSGMFAFAIWDGRQQKLVLARDRLGQKPLFYARDGEDFLFGSEVKAILAVMKRKREIDYEAIYHYLSLRFIPPPRTMFRSIKELPPAHVLVYQAGETKVSRYWDLSFRQKLDLSEADVLDVLDEKLTRAVGSHMVGDVPIGAFLSGGMDSSMIVATMAREMGPTFKTFAIGVEDQDFNELPYAKVVADQYRTNHFEGLVDANMIRSLPRIIWHLDEPSDPIAACQFYAAQLAARHVKVVVGGDGGDELFAGFDRYLGVGLIDAYAVIPTFLRRKVVGPLLAAMPESFTYKSTMEKLRWMHQLSLQSDVGRRYAEATCFFRFSHRDKRALFGNGLWDEVGYLDSADWIVEQFEAADADDELDRMLYADFMTRLPEHSLMLTDRMTMAHGVEARSPYLDHELVELAASFPSDLKIRDRELKYVFRRLAGHYLPEAIVTRPKQGFMFPVAHWFRNDLYSFIKRFLLDSYFVREGVFRRSRVSRLVEEHRRGRVDNHVRLWMLLNLAIWHQLYIEQADQGAVVERIEASL